MFTFHVQVTNANLVLQGFFFLEMHQTMFLSRSLRYFYDLWFRASSNIQIKQPTRCTLSCKMGKMLPETC
jgi:hypothetical protein